MADPSSKVLLFSLLFSFFFFFMKKVESQDTSFQILSFNSGNNRVLTYQRDAFVPRHESFVRLTGADSTGYPWFNSVGRVLYNRPVDLWGFRKQASFDTNVTLRIAAPPHRPFDCNRIGHGITFFMVPVNSTMPAGGSGQYLGIFDAVAPATPVFAVKFDSANGEGYFFNPPYSHVGININSLKSQNFTQWGPGFITARKTYDVRTKLISVAAGVARVSFFFDLATLLPQTVQVGLSAATGNPRVAYLDVHRWYFRSTMEDDIVTTSGFTETNTNAKPYACRVIHSSTVSICS